MIPPGIPSEILYKDSSSNFSLDSSRSFSRALSRNSRWDFSSKSSCCSSSYSCYDSSKNSNCDTSQILGILQEGYPEVFARILPGNLPGILVEIPLVVLPGISPWPNRGILPTILFKDSSRIFSLNFCRNSSWPSSNNSSCGCSSISSYTNSN